jgi:hypothetical protein
MVENPPGFQPTGVGMHRSETGELGRCAACDAEVRPALDRAYNITTRVVLCFDCALERGGRFDEARDVWTTLPRADDLRTDD